MVDLKATSDKLRDRAERIVMELTGLSRRATRRLLGEARGEVKTAVVMHARKVGYRKARRLLTEANGFLREAIG
jgi:N-acetylmuramic acid 6-phosphate etherase